MSFAVIFKIISFLHDLIGLWNSFKSSQDNRAAAEAAKKAADLNKAVDQSKVAETEEDIWNAQNAIVSNKP